MAVLSRDALEGSPLADLHLLARELGIDGFRRLRKADLVEAIIARQAGDGGGEDVVEAAEEAGDEVDAAAVAEAEEDEEDEGARRRRGRRGGRRRRGGAQADEAEAAEPADDAAAEAPPAEDVIAEGTVELLGNGSGFLRVSPPDPSDQDVYISAAQVRRCELVTGDRVTGPVRAPRRSERYPSLVRVDTINGRSADEVAEGTPFDELPAEFPSERLALGSEDPTLKAIEWLAPIGRGSRATIVGGARAGKTEALRRLAAALAAQDELDVSVVLAGVRPEEVPAWREAGVEPATTLTLGASPDAQAQAVERAVDTAKRVAARGGNAVVLVDTLSYVEARAARRILAPARNIVDGGSLTIVATADLPFGGETTVIALDATLTSTGRLPALDLVLSGVLRPELLVGEAGAEAIAEARATALGDGSAS
ncbi:MAG TPA: Rho termination factor N-terminal domain-containing protein [Solirubrobacteraceae bacterium]|jgi:transcription termination factor Rho|nr:Rho termination factor N-terminal domain-containing protein [Solirubrobacteraceae bacterium]